MFEDFTDELSSLKDDAVGFIQNGIGTIKDSIGGKPVTLNKPVDTLKQHETAILKNGLARTNRFQVIMALPAGIQDITKKAEENTSALASIFGEAVKIIKIFTGDSSAEYTRGLEIMVVQTSIPGKSFNITETKYNGPTQKIGSSVVYGQQQFTFKVSNDLFEKTIIDHWMNLVVDPTTYELGYQNTYVTDIVINQLNTNDKIVQSWKLYDCWPVNVNEMTLSNLEMNNTHELMVQFAYRSWVDNTTEAATSGNGLLDKLSQTPFGPYLAPILSNPAVQKGLEYLNDTTGIDLEGEAVNIYNQVDGIVKSTTGTSIGSSVSLLNGIKANLAVMDTISPDQVVKLSSIIDGTLSRLKN